MRNRNRHYQWYLEPGSPEANRVIAEALQDHESAMEGVFCADGVRRNLWPCSAHFVNQMRGFRKDLSLPFKIFVAEGKSKPRLFVGETLRGKVRSALMASHKKKKVARLLGR